MGNGIPIEKMWKNPTYGANDGNPRTDHRNSKVFPLCSRTVKLPHMGQMWEIVPPVDQKMGQIIKMGQIDQDGATWESGGNSYNTNFIQISKDAPNSKMPQIERWGKFGERCCIFWSKSVTKRSHIWGHLNLGGGGGKFKYMM